jgi:UrcA family protein
MNMKTTASPCCAALATALIGAFTCGLASLPAAADSSGVPAITVNYSDIDVSNPRGAHELFARLTLAAKGVCSKYDASNTLAGAMHRDGCVDRTVAGAVSRVNVPTLTAVYKAKNGKDASVSPALASLQK